MSSRCVVVLAVVIAACGVSAPRPTAIHSIATMPVSGGVALGSVQVGATRYAVDYTFDRNAVTAMVETAGGVIGVTASGNLLRYDRDTLAITREAVASPPVRCIATNGAEVLVGVPGGVAVLDPDALVLSRLVDVAGTPRWLGTYAHGTRLAVVVAPDQRDIWNRKPDDHREIRATLVRIDLRDRRAPVSIGDIAMPVRNASSGALPTSWLVDGHDRLWYAVDDGEFGDDVERIDLMTGAVTPIAGLQGHRVRGFVDTGGELWAYGGLEHMVMSQGVLARMAGDTAIIMWQGDGAAFRGDDGTVQITGPRDTLIRLDGAAVASSLAVTKLWRTGDHWRALLGGDLYDVSADASRWKLVVRLGTDDRVTTGLLVAGSPVVATPHAVLRIAAGVVERHAVPGQLDAGADAIVASAAGMFLTSFSDRHRAWRDDGSRWAPVELAAYANRDIEVRAVPGHAPWLFVSGTSDAPNVVARWQHGGFVEAWRGDTGPSFGVVAIADALWSHQDDQLYRFDGHGWTHVGSHPLATDRLRVMRLRAVADRPLVLDDDSHVLFDVHGHDTPHASLVARALGVEIVDAAALPDGSTLVATSAGMARLAPHATTLVPEPSLDDVRHLARDASGRIWQASTHEVAVVIDGVVQRVAIPGLDGRTITALAMEPARAEIAIALGSDGVIRLVGRQ